VPLTSAITLDSGSDAFQAQISQDTGQIALAGSDLAGKPLANVVTLEPPDIQLAGQTVPLGRVIGTPRKTATSLEVDQDLGGAKATVRITFPAEGVMRYEVIDWGGPTPKTASIAALSNDSEYFFGFGERFNKLDQAGRVVKIQTHDQPGDKFVSNHPERAEFTYKTTPWFLSSRGYGFHLDSSVESEFELPDTGRQQERNAGLLRSVRLLPRSGRRAEGSASRETHRAMGPQGPCGEAGSRRHGDLPTHR
jgi:alpha-D-xyloside xylohydrolase